MRRLLLSTLVLAAAGACGPGSSNVEVDWTFEGVSCADALGTVTHQIIQSVVVGSGRRETFAIDVPRVAPTSTASANITWTFNGQGCAAANVDHVTIMVDPDSTGAGGINAGTVACSTMGTEGAFVEPLTPGPHSFAILGLRTLSDGAHLLYRTHNPPNYFFQAGLITDVVVSAESPP